MTKRLMQNLPKTDSEKTLAMGELFVCVAATIEDALLQSGADPAREYTIFDLFQMAQPFVLNEWQSAEGLEYTAGWPEEGQEPAPKPTPEEPSAPPQEDDFRKRFPINSRVMVVGESESVRVTGHLGDSVEIRRGNELPRLCHHSFLSPAPHKFKVGDLVTVRVGWLGGAAFLTVVEVRQGERNVRCEYTLQDGAVVSEWWDSDYLQHYQSQSPEEEPVADTQTAPYAPKIGDLVTHKERCFVGTGKVVDKALDRSTMRCEWTDSEGCVRRNWFVTSNLVPVKEDSEESTDRPSWVTIVFPVGTLVTERGKDRIMEVRGVVGDSYVQCRWKNPGLDQDAYTYGTFHHTFLTLLPKPDDKIPTALPVNDAKTPLLCTYTLADGRNVVVYPVGTLIVSTRTGKLYEITGYTIGHDRAHATPDYRCKDRKSSAPRLVRLDEARLASLTDVEKVIAEELETERLAHLYQTPPNMQSTN